jgi:hypothetical protein
MRWVFSSEIHSIVHAPLLTDPHLSSPLFSWLTSRLSVVHFLYSPTSLSQFTLRISRSFTEDIISVSPSSSSVSTTTSTINSCLSLAALPSSSIYPLFSILMSIISLPKSYSPWFTRGSLSICPSSNVSDQSESQDETYFDPRISIFPPISSSDYTEKICMNMSSRTSIRQ